MLTCRELTERVTDYLDGRQTLVQRLRIRLHVGACRHCREYLRQFRHTIQAIGMLRQDASQPPPERRQSE